MSHLKKLLSLSTIDKLIQRGLPGWFPYNSVAVMQPFYTKKANTAIAKELGTIDQYTQNDPQPPRKPVVLLTSSAIEQVLSKHTEFLIPWASPLNDLFLGKKDISWYMLAGDKPENEANRTNMLKAMSKVPDISGAIQRFVESAGSKLIQKETFQLKKGLNQIDLIRDVAVPLNAQLLADLFYFDLKTDENPNGSLGAAELYEHLLDIRIWGVNNNDPGQAWNRRRKAQESAKIIIDTTRKLVDDVARSQHILLLSVVSDTIGRKASLKQGSLRSCGYKLVEQLLDHDNAERVTDILWLTAFGGIGVVVTVVSYLQPPPQPILRPLIYPPNYSSTRLWSSSYAKRTRPSGRRSRPSRRKTTTIPFAPMSSRLSASRPHSAPCVSQLRRMNSRERRFSRVTMSSCCS